MAVRVISQVTPDFFSPAPGSLSFESIVEAFDGASGKLSLDPEPIQQQRAMVAQHARDFLHGFNLGPQGSSAPPTQELACPAWALVRPKELKV